MQLLYHLASVFLTEVSEFRFSGATVSRRASRKVSGRNMFRIMHVNLCCMSGIRPREGCADCLRWVRVRGNRYRCVVADVIVCGFDDMVVVVCVRL